MSHELEDNKERRQHILAKMRQYPNGLPLQKLTALIMNEFGYNLRGAKEKIKELSFMGLIKEKNFSWYPADVLSPSRTLKGKEGRGKVTKGSVQEENTRQEEI
ncbi:MAG: hypothetical protein QXZ30_02745 [Candidatus Bilamarchaeaceae archaeon]